jgi:hypothetical protein
MKTELKNRWLVALRSADYRQGVGYLRQESSDGAAYCCIGVLCEVAGAEWSNGGYKSAGTTRYRPQFRGEVSWGSQLFAPSSLLSQSDQDILSKMNDEEGLNFNSIADWIENNVQTDDEGE